MTTLCNNHFLFLGSKCYFLIAYTAKVYNMTINPLKLCFHDQERTGECVFSFT